jgi:hypothetical protein
VTLRAAFFLFAAFAAASLRAAGIVNGDFETGSLSPWNVSTYAAAITPGSVNLVSGGFAPNTNNQLSRLYAGSYSAELYSGVGDLSHADFARIEQAVTVSPTLTLLKFYVAAVLNGAHAGTPNEDAYFEIDVIDSGGTIVNFQRYFYDNSPSPLVDDGVSGFKHLPWTQVILDLGPYVGQTMTIRFSVQDCNQGGHDCYAYVDGFALVPTPTFTFTDSPTITPTFSVSPTFTASPTRTVTPTISFTFTRSQTFTPSPTLTPTPSSTISPTFSISPTFTVSPTVTPTPTITPTYTETPLPLLLTPKYPNPDPGVTQMWLPYILSTGADVDIKVYDVAGELVRRFDPQTRSEGAHEEMWDLKNTDGRKVASGIYLYRIHAVSPRHEEHDAWMKCAVSR